MQHVIGDKLEWFQSLYRTPLWETRRYVNISLSAMHKTTRNRCDKRECLNVILFAPAFELLKELFDHHIGLYDIVIILYNHSWQIQFLSRYKTRPTFKIFICLCMPCESFYRFLIIHFSLVLSLSALESAEYDLAFNGKHEFFGCPQTETLDWSRLKF